MKVAVTLKAHEGPGRRVQVVGSMKRGERFVLPQNECDEIIAHELAFLANGADVQAHEGVTDGRDPTRSA